MDLRSRDWLLDPELMVKAHGLGLRILEVNVFARMRGGGTSHVRATTCWDFLHRLVSMRFFGASAVGDAQQRANIGAGGTSP
jgi:hypothetical protein